MCRIFMVMEFMQHDLRCLMDAMSIPFVQSEIKCLLQQLLSAMEFMHDNYVLHRCVPEPRWCGALLVLCRERRD